MGHYLCPRCGCTESFLGNILINGNGVSMTQQMGNSGVYVTSSSGGGPKAVQVIKCKNCSEMLTAANYVKSAEETEAESRAVAAANAAKTAAAEKNQPLVVVGVILGIAIIVFFLAMLSSGRI